MCFKHIYSTFQSISVQTHQSLMLIDFNFAKIWTHPDRPPRTAFACSTVSWLWVKIDSFSENRSQFGENAGTENSCFLFLFLFFCFDGQVLTDFQRSRMADGLDVLVKPCYPKSWNQLASTSHERNVSSANMKRSGNKQSTKIQ